MTIASWLLTFEPGQSAAVRQALASHPEIECRSEARSSLVVLSESPSGAGLDRVREVLQAAPWVRDAALVTTFDDEATGDTQTPRTPEP